jgi:hypothetical protein
MLGDYFIEKRKDIAHSKSLIKELDKDYENANFGIFE